MHFLDYQYDHILAFTFINRVPGVIRFTIFGKPTLLIATVNLHSSIKDDFKEIMCLYYMTNMIMP